MSEQALRQECEQLDGDLLHCGSHNAAVLILIRFAKRKQAEGARKAATRIGLRVQHYTATYSIHQARSIQLNEAEGCQNACEATATAIEEGVE